MVEMSHNILRKSQLHRSRDSETTYRGNKQDRQEIEAVASHSSGCGCVLFTLVHISLLTCKERKL